MIMNCFLFLCFSINYNVSIGKVLSYYCLIYGFRGNGIPVPSTITVSLDTTILMKLFKFTVIFLKKYPDYAYFFMALVAELTQRLTVNFTLGCHTSL